ncbi:hypothetical protein JW935_23975 [candidate division KSB1 bacterium]|nr:hypothetical protein [candidate division KSB1 bacterium]
MKRFIWMIVLISAACSPMYKAGKLYQQNNYKETLRFCRQAVRSDSSNVKAYTLMGKVFLAMGQTDSARQVLEIAEKVGTNGEIKTLLSDIHHQFGDTLVAAEEFWKALASYEKALEYDTSATVLEKMADSYVAVGKHDDAVRYYNQVLFLTGDTGLVSVKLARLDSSKEKSSNFYQLGMAALTAKKYDKSIQLLEKAVSLKPDDIETKYALQMAIGHRLFRKGSNSALWDAISAYGLAASLKTGKAEPHYFMGMAYHKKDSDEYDNAISEFETAIKKEPEGSFAKKAAQKIRELKSRRKKMKEFWGK